MGKEGKLNVDMTVLEMGLLPSFQTSVLDARTWPLN